MPQTRSRIRTKIIEVSKRGYDFVTDRSAVAPARGGRRSIASLASERARYVAFVHQAFSF